METVSRGYYPDRQGGFFGDPLDGLVYTSLQELATRIAHRNTGQYTDDPLIEKLTARIAIDENLHYVFYRELAKAALEIDPSAMMMAINRQVTGFQMPGLEIPEFKAKAIQMAKAGIYDLRIHHDQVVLPVLFKHWKIDQLTDLTDEAEGGPRGHHELPRDAGRDRHDLRREARRRRGILTTAVPTRLSARPLRCLEWCSHVRLRRRHRRAFPASSILSIRRRLRSARSDAERIAADALRGGRGTASPLVSERDQNVKTHRRTTAAGSC